METVQQTKETQQYFAPMMSSVTSRAQLKFAPALVQNTTTRKDIEVTAEHQTNLHSRLQQEAEKIRKWKVHTEIELKQKERKIQETSRTIDCLRKSMLEQQLQNESLSLKLQEEIASREEIMQKINATRDMCNLLKDYAAKVDGRLLQCERERDDLQYLELNHQKQCEDFTVNFNELESSATTTNKKLADQLQKEIVEKNEISHTFEHRLNEAHVELESFIKECEIKNNQIRAMSEQLRANEENLARLQLTKCDLEKKLGDTELVASELANGLDKNQQDLALMKVEKANLESQLQEASGALQEATLSNEKLTKNFNETEKLYVQKIENLLNELHSTQELLEKEKSTCVDLQSGLTKARSQIEDLKCAKDMLTLERTEARNRCQDLDNQRANLAKKNEDIETQVSHLSAEKSAYAEEVECLKTKIMSLQDDLKQRETMIRRKNDEAMKMDEDITSLNKHLQEKQKELDCIGEELKESIAKEECSSEQLDVLQEEINNQSGEQKVSSEKITTVMGEIKSLKKEITAGKKEMNSLKKELSTSQSKESTTSTKLDKRIEETKNLKEEISELQEEMKKTTNDGEAKLVEETNQIQSLRDELKQHQKEGNKSQKDIKHLETDATKKNNKIEDLNKEVSKWKETADMESKAKDAVARDFSMQMNELLASLDTFKLNNQKSVLDKERELEELKEKFNDATTKVKEMQSLRDELLHVKSELSNVKKDKEDKVQELLTQMEKLKCDETRPICEAPPTEKPASDVMYCPTTPKVVPTTPKPVKVVSSTPKPVKLVPTTPKAANVKMVPFTPKPAKVVPTPKPAKVVPTTPKAVNVKVAPFTPMPAKVVPTTPKAVKVVPTTPKPLAVVPSTPKQLVVMPSTPSRLNDIGLLCTPQIVLNKGILKQNGSVSKRRRVVFAPVDNVDDGASSDSFSGLEVEDEDIENHFKNGSQNGCRTPLLLRQSPRAKLSAKSPRNDRKIPVAMKPVPRGPALQTSCKTKKKPKTAEEAKFTQLFSADVMSEYQSTAVVTKKQAKPTASAKFKKTPTRSPGKFFKNSPTEKRKLAPFKAQSEDTAWFDCDAVFGFGPED